MKTTSGFLHYNTKILLFTVIFVLPAEILYCQNSDNTRNKEQKEYSTKQAISFNAQLHTAAFSGLAFMTGTFGADCFFPPGKAADLFGFQYMRDNDKNRSGHSTDFLTLIANNVFFILSNEQLEQFAALASVQARLYENFAFKRMALIKAFRQQMENNVPLPGTKLDKAAVLDFCSELYELDAEITYERAIVTGKIINSFTDQQKKQLSELEFGNSATWKMLPEKLEKRKYPHREHVCIMTYASELFSWYSGNQNADVYFCPERHCTYFGGFYLKDFPAMGKHNFNISTSLTGDTGKDFISLLTKEQSALLKKTIADAEPVLSHIVEVRTSLSLELRKALNNASPDKDTIYALFKQYGRYDGELSYNCAECYSEIFNSLTGQQKKEMMELRGLDIYPEGAFMFSDKIEVPAEIKTDFLFR